MTDPMIAAVTFLLTEVGVKNTNPQVILQATLLLEAVESRYGDKLVPVEPVRVSPRGSLANGAGKVATEHRSGSKSAKVAATSSPAIKKARSAETVAREAARDRNAGITGIDGPSEGDE